MLEAYLAGVLVQHPANLLCHLGEVVLLGCPFIPIPVKVHLPVNKLGTRRLTSAPLKAHFQAVGYLEPDEPLAR